MDKYSEKTRWPALHYTENPCVSAPWSLTSKFSFSLSSETTDFNPEVSFLEFMFLPVY